jgi:hypothetical protein
MSGETVTSKSALQFTNDNKKAYAFSGYIDVDNNETTLLEFNTNSEYIDAIISVSNASGSGDDMRYYIYYNNVIVFGWYYDSPSYTGNLATTPIPLIIPPFTTVKITGDNQSSSSLRPHTAAVAGTVGMAQRVGNLDE